MPYCECFSFYRHISSVIQSDSYRPEKLRIPKRAPRTDAFIFAKPVSLIKNIKLSYSQIDFEIPYVYVVNGFKIFFHLLCNHKRRLASERHYCCLHFNWEEGSIRNPSLSIFCPISTLNFK